MQTARLVQAVVLMLIVAMAASCAATKEYASKIFPAQTVEKDSQAVALKFLDLDKLEPDQENWVSTDIIMGRDTASGTAALDKLSEVFPSAPLKTAKKDSIAPMDTKPGIPVYVNTTPASIEKNTVSGSVSKNSNVKKVSAASTSKDSVLKSEKTTPVVSTNSKPEEETEIPVARNYNSGEVREKKSRDDQ